MKKSGLITLFIFALALMMASCEKEKNVADTNQLQGDTWAEKLGYPKDKVVLMLHADDIGMCEEANESAIPYLLNDHIQSAAVMVPCAYFEAFAAWYKDHPNQDIGLHLTLTSEWKTWRWSPVAGTDKVPGLVDDEGYMWRDVMSVVQHASAAEIETEIRAQMEKALSLGIQPGHIDTHMGTLYASYDYTAAYLKIAEEYNIPAMAINMSEDVAEKFRAQGYPITDGLVELINTYPLPKLDDFHAVGPGSTYEEKKQNFYNQVRNMQPGLNEIIFHPSVLSENLKTITNSWQQRVWEAQMFSDPEVQQFFEDEGIVFTNWKEIMQRYNERKGS